MPDLSVIIVNWNTRKLLRQCLNSIKRWTHALTYEIVVVDNGSADGSPEMVTREFPRIHLIRNQNNVGFARANNQAISHTSGRSVLLLNSDTALQENSCKAMVDFMDAHPPVGLAGARLVNPDGTHQESCDLFPRRPWQLARDKLLDAWKPANAATRTGQRARWQYTRNFAVEYVTGAALMIRRKTLEDIGGLDERFFMYAEDIDWCYRAAAAGWQVYYLGTVSLIHSNRGSSQASPELAARLEKLRRDSLLQWYRKHYGYIAYLLMKIVMAVKRWKTPIR